jgi:hypothetical protein
MRISAFFILFFAFVTSVGGFYLRVSELLNVFDPFTGLPERGATTSLGLIILSVVFLLIILIFTIFVAVRHQSPKGFENAFGTDPLFYPIMFVIIGIVWLVGTYMFFADLRTAGALHIIDVCFAVLSAISAVCITFFAIEMFQDSRRKTPYTLSIVPTVFMCFWLILLYRQNASNPILLSYVYQCLAIVSAALSFYFTSGFLYDKPAPGKAVFTYFATIYFCTVTLADSHPLSIRLIFCSIIAANTIHAAMLISNLQRKTS